MVWLTDRPDMTIAVYRDVKQQHSEVETAVKASKIIKKKSSVSFLDSVFVLILCLVYFR